MDSRKYYKRVLFTAIVVLLVALIIIKGIENKFDQKYEQVTTDFLDKYYQCEFHYKDLYYKGICSEDLLEDAKSFIEFDAQLKLLELCTNSPYAYRYDACKELGVK